MSPRTNSPTPSFYGLYDDANDMDYQPGGPSMRPSSLSTGGYHNNNNSNNSNGDNNNRLSQRGLSRNDDITGTPNNNNNNGGIFPSIFSRSLNLPRRVLSSTAAQFVSLLFIYSFCITTLWVIFCASYFLTFYDDTRRIFRTSRVWAQVKNGVRERIAMMGDDWEEFIQKYFDQWDEVDENKNGHLGGGTNNNNASASTSTSSTNNSNDNDNDNNSTGTNNGPRDAEWEDWIKDTMFRFMTVVAGQDATDKFKQSASSFQSRFRGRSATASAGGSETSRK